MWNEESGVMQASALVNGSTSCMWVTSSAGGRYVIHRSYIDQELHHVKVDGCKNTRDVNPDEAMRV